MTPFLLATTRPPGAAGRSTRYALRIAACLVLVGVSLHARAEVRAAQQTIAEWAQVRNAMRHYLEDDRQRLWLLKEDALYLYDAWTRQLAKRVHLPEWMHTAKAFNCPPDLIHAKSGAILVTSNFLPQIWEVDPSSFAVRRHNLRLDADESKDVGFTTLAFVGDQLVGISALHGSMWHLDLSAGTASKVALSEPIYGACAMRRPWQ